jgi:hypothetical protein
MMVASGARTCSGRHLRRLATLAVVLIMLGAVTSRAQASPLRQLARSTTSFASDGGRYAAWQLTPASPIVVLDTLNDHEREMKMPGCVLADAERTEATAVTEVTDGGGRFLLSCLKVQRLLDVQTETSIPLPEGNTWTRVGTRYLEAREPGKCSPPARYCVRVAFFDIATGIVSNRLLRYAEPTYELERADLDRGGAPQERVCRTLRHAMLTSLKYGFLGEQLAFQDGVFAHPTANGHNIRIERCNGRSTLLRGPSEPAAEPGGVHPSEPRSFDLSDGLLTWDTGHNSGGAEMNEQSNAQGTLSSYRLSTGRRRTWKLPPLALLGAPNIDGSGPEVESPGVYGYSAHTANTVFWIATRSVRGAALTSGLIVETSSVYAASVKSVAPPARAQPASSYKFEDLTITRQVAADGKPNSGFVSYFRLNRALLFAPRGKFEVLPWEEMPQALSDPSMKPVFVRDPAG